MKVAWGVARESNGHFSTKKQRVRTLLEIRTLCCIGYLVFSQTVVRMEVIHPYR